MSQPEDHERFTELLWAHHTQLFGYLYRAVHDINDAEDLYEETITVLWKKFGEYREGTSFFSWARVLRDTRCSISCAIEDATGSLCRLGGNGGPMFRPI